jgi:hypothetical protein
MPLDRLQVLHAHDVIELPGVHDLLDRAHVWRVPQHAPDDQRDPGLLLVARSAFGPAIAIPGARGVGPGAALDG